MAIIKFLVLPSALEVGFERESYTVDEVTGRLEVNVTSSVPFLGPMEVVLTLTTHDGTAEGWIKKHLIVYFQFVTMIFVLHFHLLNSQDLN